MGNRCNKIDRIQVTVESGQWVWSEGVFVLFILFQVYLKIYIIKSLKTFFKNLAQ